MVSASLGKNRFMMVSASLGKNRFMMVSATVSVKTGS